MALTELQEIFAEKLTEKGDKSYNTTGNKLVDILFMSQYFRSNLNEAHIGNTTKEKIFSMFIRDPRYGIGERDLGRRLMAMAELEPAGVIVAGRADDLLHMSVSNVEYFRYFCNLLRLGDLNAKKWSPRFTNERNKKLSRLIMKELNINSNKEYRKLVKVNTIECKISENRLDEIEFSKVPSLAFSRYLTFFYKKMEDKITTFMKKVEKGEEKINTGVLTPYDLALKFLNGMKSSDAEIIWGQIKKINLGSILPIVDNSGSMYNSTNCHLKAKAIAHYVTHNSTYHPGTVITFESNPKLLNLNSGSYAGDMEILNHDSDMGATSFYKVMNLLSKLENDFPDYFLVLSDMEFDCGSRDSKEEAMKIIRDKGAHTKIIWWNFNDRNKTCPELDSHGNIFISGYSPQMLQFLQSGFNADEFLNELLDKYIENVGI